MRSPDEEDLHILNAVASLEAEPLSAGEARARMLAAARRVNVCLDAGEYDAAREQLAESKRLAVLAINLDQGEAA